MFFDEAMNCKSCGKEITFLGTDMGTVVSVDKETIYVADEYFDRDRHVTHFRACAEAGQASLSYPL